MKNKLVLSIVTLLFSVSVFAANGSQVTAIKPALTTRAFDGTNPPADAQTIIQEIIDVVGLKPNFEIRQANIPNAAAVIYGGKRYILYNPDFFTALTKSTGNKWAAVSVLAHEIGHHLDGHTLSQIGSQPQSELEADEFSGFVLRKMGANLDDAQVAMKTAATQRETATHPGQYDRLIAIANGWNKAEAQLTGRKFTPVNPSQTAPQQPAIASISQPQRQTAIDPANIIGKVRFNADASTAYYVTSRYNLVRVKDNQLAVIGKLANLNSSRFPYMIYDEANTQLLVDAYGHILTREGAEVGILQAN